MVNATQTENRTEYACRPTNEDSLAAFLVDLKDYHFFKRDILQKNVKLSQLFSFQMQSMRRIHFGWLLTTRNASNEEKKENQDNCSWPSWRGILQSSNKAASSEEWINEWYNGLDEQPLLQSLENIIFENAFLDMQGKKTILNCLENSCMKNHWRFKERKGYGVC